MFVETDILQMPDVIDDVHRKLDHAQSALNDAHRVLDDEHKALQVQQTALEAERHVLDGPIELPWDERIDDLHPQDLIIPERPETPQGSSDVPSHSSDFQTEPHVPNPGDDVEMTHDGDQRPGIERPVSASGNSDDNRPLSTRPGSERSRSGWTIVLLCLGLATIACCVIIPQADANRRLAYEQQKLQMDLDQIKNQTGVNKEFLKNISTDATLAERLAQRQMKMIPRGTTVLELRDQPKQNDMSPFLLVNLPAPTPLPAYKPVGGVIADVCTNPKKRLYLLGAGLFLVAAGLVMGGTIKRKADASMESD